MFQISSNEHKIKIFAKHIKTSFLMTHVIRLIFEQKTAFVFVSSLRQFLPYPRQGLSFNSEIG
jgi:hypothetical protein